MSEVSASDLSLIKTLIHTERLKCNKIFTPYIFSVQKSKSDVSNFDDDFTFQEAKLTPSDTRLIMSIDQSNFAGFSFANEQFDYGR